MKKTITFQNQSVIEIRIGEARALFAPQYGARLLLWEIGDRRIIYWPEEADWSKHTKVRGGNPVLFPFIARHYVDSVIEKWQDYADIVRPMPMHGFSRNCAFLVIDDDEDTLRMRLESSPATREFYPFEFSFEVVYRLTETSLTCEFIVTNSDPLPMPYYAGHHFYFDIPHQERAQWQLELPYAQSGRQNPDGSIVAQPLLEKSPTLDRPEIIDRFQLDPTDSVYTLFNASRSQGIRFELNDPRSIPWYATTTWTEFPTSDFFCVEPWLGLPNAIHHGQGLRMLSSGDTETSICRLVAY